MNPSPHTEISSDEIISENYFERVNSEYFEVVTRGDYNNETTLTGIKERNSEGFFDLLKDFFGSPVEALKWMGTQLVDHLAGQWIQEITDTVQPLLERINQVFDVIRNPFMVLEELTSDIFNSPLFSRLNFTNLLELSGSRNLFEVFGQQGLVLYNIIKLKLFLQDNPQISQDANDTDLANPQWWTSIMEQAEIEIEYAPFVLPFVLGQSSIGQLLTGLGTSGQPLPSTAEPDNNTEAELEQVAEAIPEGRVTINEFIDIHTQNMGNLVTRIEDGANHSINGDRVLSYAGIGTLSYILRGPILATANSVGRFGATSVSSLVSLSKISFNFGVNHPIAFGSLMLASAGMSIYLDAKISEGLDTATVPVDPIEFKNEILETLRISSTWQTIKESISEEEMQKVELALDYLINPERFTELLEDFDPTEFITTASRSIAESAGITENERVIRSNQIGLRNFDSLLRVRFQSTSEEYSAMRLFLERFESKLILGQNINSEDITEFIEFFEPYGISFFEDEEGYIKFFILDEDGIVLSNELSLFVNPNLDAEDQYQAARRFVADASALNGFSGIFEGMLLGDMREVIEKVKNGGVLTVIGDSFSLIFENTVVRLGPIQVMSELIEALTAEERNEIEVNEFMFEWANGILPMMVIGLPRATIGFITGSTSGDGFSPRAGMYRFMTKFIGTTVGWPIYVTKTTLSLSYNALRLAFSENARIHGTQRLRRIIFSEDAQRFLNLNAARKMLQMRCLMDRIPLIGSFAHRSTSAILNGTYWSTRFRRIMIDAGLEELGTSFNFSNLSKEQARLLLEELDNKYLAKLTELGNTPFQRGTSRLIARAGSAIGNGAVGTGRFLRSIGGSRSGRAAVGTTVIAAAAGGLSYALSGSEAVEEPLTIATIERVQGSSSVPSEALEQIRSQSIEDETTLQEYGFLNELHRLNTPYSEVRTFLDPVNLVELDEDSAFMRIQDLGNLHQIQVEKFLEAITANKAVILEYFRANPETPILSFAEQNLTIEVDPENSNDLNVKYTDNDEFCNLLWNSYDFNKSVNWASGEQGNPITALRNLQVQTELRINQVADNSELSDQEIETQIFDILEEYQTAENAFADEMNRTARNVSSGGIAMDVLPLVGGYRDLERVQRSFERGRVWEGIGNSVSFLASSVGDVLTLGAGGTAMRLGAISAKIVASSRFIAGGVQRGRAVLASLRATRLANNGLARGAGSAFDFVLRNKNKALWAAIGIDIGRIFFVPFELNQEIKI